MDRPPLTEVAALLVDAHSSVGTQAQRELLTGNPLGAEARSILADVERYQRHQRSVSFDEVRKELINAINRPSHRRRNPRFSAGVVRYAAGKQRALTANPRLARRLALAATELSRKEPLDLAGTLRNLRPDALPLREIMVARYASPPARLSTVDLEGIAARLEPGERLLELAPLLVDEDLDEERLRRRREELLAYRVAVLGLRPGVKSLHAIGTHDESDLLFDFSDSVSAGAPPADFHFEPPPGPAPELEGDASTNPPPPDEPPPAPPHDTRPEAPVETGHQRHAWPLLAAPDAVAPETEFTVTVGLSASPAAGVGGTGRLALPTGPFTLDLELDVDPDSFTILDGHARRSLPVTCADSYPSLTMKLSANADPALKPTRQLGCTFRVDDVLCGYATRLIEVVPEGAEPQGIDQPTGTAPPIDVLELDRDTLPDLTIVIRHGDDLAETKLIWKLYSPCVTVPVDIAPMDIGERPQDFTKSLMDTGEVATDDPVGLFDYLVGSGRQLGGRIPPEVRRVLTALPAEVAGGVPAVLIATADPYLPWELAVIDDDIPDEESPFLGGRVAIGRWPLTSREPAPKPLSAVIVSDRAVVSGSYLKVQGVPELEAAEAEGKELLESWPGARDVQPTYASLRKLMRGSPGADLVHVALHGKFSDSIRNGLVLIGIEKKGVRMPYYLQPNQILGWKLMSRPFVFLNACQVGAGTRVLGDYAGTASSLLTAGASSVIAPLWSIDDSVAHTIATEFYRSALDAPPGDTVAVAEFLRRARARFTAAAIESDEGAGASTYLAFQYFGHPRLELRKAGG